MTITVTLAAAALPFASLAPSNLPSDDECEIAGIEYDRTEPTFISEGEITGATLFISCEFKVPTDVGAVRTVRDVKWIELDAEQAQVLIDAAEELVEGD